MCDTIHILNKNINFGGNKMKKVLSLALAIIMIAMCACAFSSCGKEEEKK